MDTVEASFNGTLRTILVLVVLWWLLRLALRQQGRRSEQPGHMTNEPVRPRGEVRVEDAARSAASDRQSRIIDADFEEIK